MFRLNARMLCVRLMSDRCESYCYQDVQYADIDHMDERKDFTVDNVNFAGLNDYWQSLRAGGMHTVIILVNTLMSSFR